MNTEIYEIIERENERRKWQNPEEILEDIGLEEGKAFADIGCGNGFFTIPAAKMVGESGKVYAVDKSPETISILKQRLKDASLNAKLVTGMAENTIFCYNCIDIIFFSIVLHDFEDPIQVLSNTRKMVKRDGILVNIDWHKKELPIGPPTSKKFTVEKSNSMIEKNGYKVTSMENLSNFLYKIIAQPV